MNAKKHLLRYKRCINISHTERRYTMTLSIIVAHDKQSHWVPNQLLGTYQMI